MTCVIEVQGARGRFADGYAPGATQTSLRGGFQRPGIYTSTLFMLHQLVPSEDAQTVVVRGRLRTLVNGFETANDLKAYLVEFSFNGARMHLKAFKELSNAN